MKKIKKTIKELLILFSEFDSKAIDEIKKTQKVLKSLQQLRSAKIEKIHFHQDLRESYLEIRSKISSGLWENWVIRRIFYNFHIWQYCHSATKHIYHDLLNYIKNVMDIPTCIEDFPLHKAVFENKLYQIRQLCIGEDSRYFYIHIDQPDLIGNTALMLAVKLNLYDEVQVLIDHGADPKYRILPSVPSPLEQAVAMEDKQMLMKLVSGYHRELHMSWNDHIEEFASTLKKIPDFSLNMSWECVSNFIPFLRKFTPSDEYYICKKGGNLKIDLTLVGWEQFKAKRGKMSLMFIGDYNKVILIDHNKKTSRELFNDLSAEQVEKHTNVNFMQELLRDKKYSGDMKFSDCHIEAKKNWRGHEQQKLISGYHAKKYEVQCNLALSMKKRQVVLEKELKNIRTFEEYFEYCLKDSHKSFVLASKMEKSSMKKIKASIWSAKNFPMSIIDLMPLLDLLASVSQKARRFNEFLSSAEMLQQIGFPVRAKIPLFLTVTALVMFKDLKIGNINIKEFELENIESEILFSNLQCQPSLSIIAEDFDEECDPIGPKIRLNPAPKLQDEESETTFIREFINIGEEIKEKVKAVELHTIILSKIKKFIENNQNTSNDIDVMIL